MYERTSFFFKEIKFTFVFLYIKQDINLIQYKMHKRNKHINDYNFGELISFNKELSKYVRNNKYGNESIDFSNLGAVKALNKALLFQFYDIEYWELPSKFLCPPIPGRADYIHYAADLLKQYNNGVIPKGEKYSILDIGTGANLIYPIIANKEYSWQVSASELNPEAYLLAQKIIQNNKTLEHTVNCIKQDNASSIFEGIIKPSDMFILSICNPPFHSSEEEANKANKRKNKNLFGKKNKEVKKNLNFGGTANELWCLGGEKEFLKKMISESKLYSKNCIWFTSLVSKKTNLPSLYKEIKNVKANISITIEMQQGQKISRFIAWSFFSKEEIQKLLK